MQEKKAKESLQKIIRKHHKHVPAALIEIKRRVALDSHLQQNREPYSSTATALSNNEWDSCISQDVVPQSLSPISSSAPNPPEELPPIEKAITALLDIHKNYFETVSVEQFAEQSHLAFKEVGKSKQLKKLMGVLGSVATVIGIILTTYYNVKQSNKK